MQAGIFYYAREGYYRHLHNAALERLKQFGSDPVLLFWKAYAIIMEGIIGCAPPEAQSHSSIRKIIRLNLWHNISCVVILVCSQP